ncbi:hypothetical protein [Paraburkholderia unamae]|jgi:hypothetical protein|uniref:Uncharacterized protein n=1 Tax=Paraburkholderia unamae TaxID=219649 RepID=A0ABX5K7S1_9BURK|nr:hypothetical protein [Paraburkholderia unamae]PVX59484.1 hypothetical protein C7402_1532 [Paraburkholderia unamae]RAR57634.1 hypothetical protein C7401_115192 [Paraburkholderia unamae]CAG9257795.1 conserved hypothetical protein [Paraburkholderia unamae]
MESIKLEGVTPEQMAHVARYLERSGVKGFSGNAGALAGDCFKADYRYEPESGILVITPSELPHAFRKAPAGVAAPAFAGLVRNVLTGRPSKYGVYDYVYPTIDNQSGGTLTYSTSDPSNGTIEIKKNKIESGSSVEAFEADSTKLSGTGVGGTCTYTLADGQTTLVITYFLNTKFTHTFTVGLSGGNAARYTATATNTDPSVDGYTYLNPTVTLAKVTNV